MGNKQSTGVNFAFAAIGAFLVFTGIFLYTGLDRLNEDRASAIHTTKVIDNLQRLLADILDAEAGERAFLILRDDTAFARIESALARAEEHLAGLEILLNESSDQKQNLEHLRSLAHTRMQISRELLARTRSGGKSDLPSEYIQTTRIHMRDLRAHLAKISVNQYAELEDRTQKTEAMEGYVKLVLIASSLISILAIFAVSILFRRFVTQQNIEAARRAHEAWLQQNEAEIARVAINENSVERMAEPSIRILVEALKAIAGNLFIADGPHLKLVAGYGGVDSDSTNDKTFTLGRGLVGEAALGEDLTILKDVPENYFHLRSSLGSSAPKHIVFVPLRFQGQLVGLLEIASFISINEEGKALLRHLSTPLAAGFNAAINRDKQQSLLEETQIQAEELQAQQEELRTSNEELEQQSSALLESQARLQAQQEELQQNNEELEQQTRGLEEQQEFISKRNSELETIRTELESKAGDLARANTYKSEFLAKMSHELRTPLNSLMILATLLKENKQGNLEKQQIEFAETIHDAGADLLNLINDILDLSKLEARKLSARPENFQVRSMFDQLALTFRPLIDQKKLQLQLNIAQDTPETIYTDRQRLQQILTNFLSNAVKFTDEGNIVLEASLSDRAGFLKISVSDSGTGIAEEKRRLIFEAFEQGDGSISRKYGGTGLGLTISRELSVLLGGSISVTSEIGKGSQFTIEIPIDLQTAKAFEETGIESGLTIPKYEIKPQSAALQAPLASTPSAMADDSFAPIAKALVSSINPGDRTILIVEDELNFRSAIADAARAQGFTPIEAGDAETALAVVKIHTPKAIMLDIKLPGLSGLTLLEMIKEIPRLRHVPVHMVSALEYQRNALRLGAIGYLGKPVSIEGVRSAIDRLEQVMSQDLKRLLVVEDDERQRRAILELVGGKDIEVIAVGTSRAALEEIDRRPVDCIILDLTLPDMSGFAFLERLNQTKGRSLPPVIIYTGKDLSKNELEALQRYSDSIIIKGARSPERLLDEVSLFLHRVETSIPEEKREMMANLRHRDRAFEGRSILVVDDDLRNVFALTSALEAKGFKVDVARNGIEALDKLDSGVLFDVVLMDIMMPKMDGFEAMKRIRAQDRFKTLPVIALTAKTMKGEQERCIQAGASDYLPKPINLMNLLSALKAWLPVSDIHL